VVIREPERINPHELLLDGRWRETAVTICQLQWGQTVIDLLEEADDTLAQGLESLGIEGSSVKAIMAGTSQHFGHSHFLGQSDHFMY
jgi:hypothetical protein